MQNFSSIPQSDAYRDEFELFKLDFPLLTINDLVNYDVQSVTKKYDNYDQTAINIEDLTNVLKFMSVNAMVRLNLYTLADSIEVINAVAVFVISPDIDGRMIKTA